ncbi:hypothetical protein PGTUg99_035238 [Puccinia graminis f. sp. tritici]|uniref:Uncharacterized protein n=1 Tax=Puccinia graminis f. sp. tritici TaxID=56615 RepID=A0A5B0RQP4_PUCGR|nr:hypothetical protein PGTUg99_035238 [Puccinia graminis f. sp. tritici]
MIMEAQRPKIRNILKSNARRRRRAADRQSEVALEIDASSYVGERVIWSRRRFKKCHLYPAIRDERKRTPRHPTVHEVEYAQKMGLDSASSLTGRLSSETPHTVVK